MDQSEFLAITCNLLKAREKSHVLGAIGFGFASHRLKSTIKRSSRNHVITFDIRLRTALFFCLTDGVECEFRERHVRMTFREAVQLFENRSQFIKRSSDACLVRQFTLAASFFWI